MNELSRNLWSSLVSAMAFFGLASAGLFAQLINTHPDMEAVINQYLPGWLSATVMMWLVWKFANGGYEFIADRVMKARQHGRVN